MAIGAISLLRALHESHFSSMLCLPHKGAPRKTVLNRSFININFLIPCVFALPESEIIFRAKPQYTKIEFELLRVLLSWPNKK